MPLSPFVHFGTSTWAYEGWQGMVYHKAYPNTRFKQDCSGPFLFEFQGSGIEPEAFLPKLDAS